MLIGCSELTGRYWNGGAIIHTSVSEGKNPQNIPKKNIHLSSGTADGCFLGKLDKVHMYFYIKNNFIAQNKKNYVL